MGSVEEEDVIRHVRDKYYFAGRRSPGSAGNLVPVRESRNGMVGSAGSSLEGSPRRVVGKVRVQEHTQAAMEATTAAMLRSRNRVYPFRQPGNGNGELVRPRKQGSSVNISECSSPNLRIAPRQEKHLPLSAKALMRLRSEHNVRTEATAAMSRSNSISEEASKALTLVVDEKPVARSLVSCASGKSRNSTDSSASESPDFSGMAASSSNSSAVEEKQALTPASSSYAYSSSRISSQVELASSRVTSVHPETSRSKDLDRQVSLDLDRQASSSYAYSSPRISSQVDLASSRVNNVHPETSRSLDLDRQASLPSDRQALDVSVAAAVEEKQAVVSSVQPPSSSPSSSSANMKVKMKAADMSESMQNHAIKCAQEVIASTPKLNCKRVAWTLKKEFDISYGPVWHCIVGTSFGSFVTHTVGGFVYFSIGKASVLLFQTAVEVIEQS